MLCSEATFAVYLDAMLEGDCAPCPHDPSPGDVYRAERAAEARKAEEARRREEAWEAELNALPPHPYY
jgi:hypothetical protein